MAAPAPLTVVGELVALVVVAHLFLGGGRGRGMRTSPLALLFWLIPRPVWGLALAFVAGAVCGLSHR